MIGFKGRRPAPPAARPADQPPPPWALDPEGLLRPAEGNVKAALTGGIASGKSTVAALLEAFGARLVDFDVLAREALEPGTPTWERALALFGPKARLADGQLDRPFMAKKVFKDPELRQALEDIVHPFTWGRMLQELSRGGPWPLTVVDIPLLYEANLQSLFPVVILSFATPATQIRRLLSRSPGLSERQAKRILKNQLPITDKLRRADVILNNEGGLRDLIRQAKELYLRLTAPGGPALACQGAPGGPGGPGRGLGDPGGPGGPDGSKGRGGPEGPGDPGGGGA